MQKKGLVVLGAGSWGTAVAVHLAKQAYPVLLWGRDAVQIKTMEEERSNQRYLPGISFPPSLQVSSNLAACLNASEEIIIGVPSHAFVGLLNQLPKPIHGLCWLTKGMDPKSHTLFSQIVSAQWGEDFPFTILSGPSFALELAKGLPTAVTLAGNDLAYQNRMQALLHKDNLRVYLSKDYIGVQLCGAVKNVLAIASGISDGLGYGANAKAALITRGLAEMSRLGQALGAREETFMGLAGLGDLVLSCTDDQSRNRRFGLKIGQGLSFKEAEKQIAQVIEGKQNAAEVLTLAEKLQIEMPICQQVHALLEGSLSTEEAVSQLMQREPKIE